MSVLTAMITLPWFLLFIRLVLASVMIYYGLQKVRDLHANAEDFEYMGFKPGMVFGTPIAILEFFGGIFIALGVYVEVIAALFAFQMMLGTFWKIKIKKGFPDYSYDMLAFALAGVLIGFGGGALTIASWTGVGSLVLRWSVFVGALILAGLAAWWSKPQMGETSEESEE